MVKNRMFLVIGVLSLLLIAMTVSLPRLGAVTSPVRSAQGAQPNIMDSATRSYIAWGQSMQVRNAIDSATRSYIAQGKALEATGKLGESGACSTTSQENIFARIPGNLDSATRSYIAWGLALQANDNILAACR